MMQNQTDITATGAVPLTLPSFPKFDLDEFTTVGPRWIKYKTSFENLSVALNITFDKQKLALLLNYIGEEPYDVYDNMLTPGTEEIFESELQLLDDHFNPCKNLEYEIFQFHQITQRQDETIHQFYIRVKAYASKCGFENRLEQEIKSQIILTANNNKLRRYAFKNLY